MVLRIKRIEDLTSIDCSREGIRYRQQTLICRVSGEERVHELWPSSATKSAPSPGLPWGARQHYRICVTQQLLGMRSPTRNSGSYWSLGLGRCNYKLSPSWRRLPSSWPWVCRNFTRPSFFPHWFSYPLPHTVHSGLAKPRFIHEHYSWQESCGRKVQMIKPFAARTAPNLPFQPVEYQPPRQSRQQLKYTRSCLKLYSNGKRIVWLKRLMTIKVTVFAFLTILK